MRQVYFMLLGMALLSGACQSHTHGDSTPAFKKEIPTYLGVIADVYYQLAKDRENQLGLDNLDNGFADLQVRVWYNASLVKDQKLVVIKNKDINWSATIYDFRVTGSDKGETIISKTIRQVTPELGWPAFSKKLLDLQIMTLPNQDDVEGYSAGDNGTTYSVEVATKHQYRFYNYWQPQQYQDRFWQAKNMTGILKLFETELDD